MRYLDTLVDMRRRGIKPARVDLCDLPLPPDMHRALRRLKPEVVFAIVEPFDNVARLDLRSLVGCEVWVSAGTEARMREVFAAAQDHGASRVVGTFCPFDTHGQAHCSLILDTAGTLTWPREMHPEEAVHG